MQTQMGLYNFCDYRPNRNHPCLTCLKTNWSPWWPKLHTEKDGCKNLRWMPTGIILLLNLLFVALVGVFSINSASKVNRRIELKIKAWRQETTRHLEGPWSSGHQLPYSVTSVCKTLYNLNIWQTMQDDYSTHTAWSRSEIKIEQQTMHTSGPLSWNQLRSFTKSA